MAGPGVAVQTDEQSPNEEQSSESSGTTGVAEDARSQWVCTCRVVTLSALDGIGDEICRVVVPRDAVVTPAVVDRLKERGVELSRGNVRGGALNTPYELFLQCWRTPYPVEPLLRLLREQGHVVSAMPADKPFDAILTALVHRPRRGGAVRLGLVLTDRPAAAVCLANRHPRIRATWGYDVKSMSEAVESIAANLLVVQPDRLGDVALAEMVKHFVSNPQRTCPEDVRKLL